MPIKIKTKKTRKKLINRNNRKAKKDFAKEKTKLIKSYIQKYNKYTDKKLKKELEEILKSLDDKSTIDEEKINNEYKITAIKYIIENREIKLLNKQTQKVADLDQFIYYPNFLDNNFTEKIYSKKEFYENKIVIGDKDINKLAESRCNKKHFNLMPTQIFLKNFISPETPYNSILIWHGTGVGKTCSAITIAEQFKEYVKRENKKMFVLRSPSIKENFKNQLFDIHKVKNFEPYTSLSEIAETEISQCTGNNYLKEINDSIIENKDFLNKKVNKAINTHYTFMGYDQFANFVEKLENSAVIGNLDENQKYLLQKEIRKKYFSDTVLIIDEAHHIRISDSNNTNKIAPPVIERVIRDSENMILVLLTATPMYNSPREIIWILNLLLQNDNRPKIYENDIFDSNDNILKSSKEKLQGLELLRAKAEGYISYLRGENPYSFPFRLYPNINNDKSVIQNRNIPTETMNGNLLEDIQKLKYLKLIGCEMKNYQFESYLKLVEPLLNVKKKKRKTSDISSDSDIDDIINKKGFSALEKGIQASNIIFPDNGDTKNIYYGKKGLENAFEITHERNINKYKYKSNIIKKYGNFLICPKEDSHDLKYTLNDFSSKIDKIMKYVYNSQGIVYIYSQHITSGILPIALALEQNGYKKYGKNQLLDAKKSEPISFEGKKKSEYKDLKDFKQGNYIIITGSDDITQNNDYELNILNSLSNKNGENIKIVLGSPASGEGIDMKRIREIHILDPWHHLNRLEQVIGRGIRNCSHIDLDLKFRNCTIYLHCAISCKKHEFEPWENRETVDLRVYRKAELKSIKMGEIENELKKISIDCSLNRQGNIFLEKDWGQIIPIVTSQKIKAKYTIGDKPYSSLCNFKKNCDYICNPNLKQNLSKSEIDTDTYNLNFAKPNILIVLKMIKSMFKNDFIFELRDIKNYIHENKENVEDMYIYNALDILISDIDQKVIDKFGNEGNIIYKGGFYIFQPVHFNEQYDNKIPMYWRNKPLPSVQKHISLLKNQYYREISNLKKTKKKTMKTDRLTGEQIFARHKENLLQKIPILENDDFLKTIGKNYLYLIYCDYLIDRMNYNELKIFLSYIVKILNHKKKENLNYFEKLVIQSLKNYFFKDKKKKINHGFRIINNDKLEYWLEYPDGKIKKSDQQSGNKLIHKEGIENSYHGYMSYLSKKKNKQIEVKIVNQDSRNSTGAVCKEITPKGIIGKIINEFTKEKHFIKWEKNGFINNGKKVTKIKDDLCQYLELLLRYSQLIEDVKKTHKKIYFYRTYEK